MYSIKKQICNSKFCHNWEVLATEIEDFKEAYYIMEQRADRTKKTHLQHIYGIFEDDNTHPLRKMEG